MDQFKGERRQHEQAALMNRYEQATYFLAMRLAYEHREFIHALANDAHKELRWRHLQSVLLDVLVIGISASLLYVALRH
jgi:hypothetical protein